MPDPAALRATAARGLWDSIRAQCSAPMPDYDDLPEDHRASLTRDAVPPAVAVLNAAAPLMDCSLDVDELFNLAEKLENPDA